MIRVATLVILALSILSAPASAKIVKDRDRVRAEAEHACYEDANRLCPDAIPNEDKIEACMRAKRSQLSPACNKFFD